jgi:adenylate kinase family enzyme
MDRVSVVGCPGSSKATFATVLAERMGTSHLELDSLYHQNDWEPLPDEEFRSAVTRVIGGERWVVDDN